MRRSYVASISIPMGCGQDDNCWEVVKEGSNGGGSRVLVRGGGMILDRQELSWGTANSEGEEEGRYLSMG